MPQVELQASHLQDILQAACQHSKSDNPACGWCCWCWCWHGWVGMCKDCWLQERGMSTRLCEVLGRQPEINAEKV